MRVSGWKLSLIAACLATFTAWADATSNTPESQIATMKKNCLRAKKAKGVCSCVVKNIDAKFKNGRLSDQQLSDAVAVLKGSVSDTRLDYMADLIAGLEFHCMENSNYSAD